MIVKEMSLRSRILIHISKQNSIISDKCFEIMPDDDRAESKHAAI